MSDVIPPAVEPHGFLSRLARTRGEWGRRVLSPWTRAFLGGNTRARVGLPRRAQFAVGPRLLLARVRSIIARGTVWKPDLGSLTPSLTRRFGDVVTARYRGALRPISRRRAASSAGPWGDQLELALPGRLALSAGPADELRAGTRIAPRTSSQTPQAPGMLTVGQRIEPLSGPSPSSVQALFESRSAPAETGSRPRSYRPAARSQQRRQLAPDARLFSRVEEVKPERAGETLPAAQTTQPASDDLTGEEELPAVVEPEEHRPPIDIPQALEDGGKGAATDSPRGTESSRQSSSQMQGQRSGAQPPRQRPVIQRSPRPATSPGVPADTGEGGTDLGVATPRPASRSHIPERQMPASVPDSPPDSSGMPDRLLAADGEGAVIQRRVSSVRGQIAAQAPRAPGRPVTPEASSASQPSGDAEGIPGIRPGDRSWGVERVASVDRFPGQEQRGIGEPTAGAEMVRPSAATPPLEYERGRVPRVSAEADVESVTPTPATPPKEGSEGTSPLLDVPSKAGAASLTSTPTLPVIQRQTDGALPAVARSHEPDASGVVRGLVASELPGRQNSGNVSPGHTQSRAARDSAVPAGTGQEHRVESSQVSRGVLSENTIADPSDSSPDGPSVVVQRHAVARTRRVETGAYTALARSPGQFGSSPKPVDALEMRQRALRPDLSIRGRTGPASVGQLYVSPLGMAQRLQRRYSHSVQVARGARVQRTTLLSHTNGPVRAEHQRSMAKGRSRRRIVSVPSLLTRRHRKSEAVPDLLRSGSVPEFISRLEGRPSLPALLPLRSPQIGEAVYPSIAPDTRVPGGGRDSRQVRVPAVTDRIAQSGNVPWLLAALQEETQRSRELPLPAPSSKSRPEAERIEMDRTDVSPSAVASSISPMSSSLVQRDVVEDIAEEDVGPETSKDDLSRLASLVYPFVKRLLAIERERWPRR